MLPDTVGAPPGEEALHESLNCRMYERFPDCGTCARALACVRRRQRRSAPYVDELELAEVAECLKGSCCDYGMR